MKIGIIGYGWLAKQILPVLEEGHEVLTFSRSAVDRPGHFVVDWDDLVGWPEVLGDVDFFLLMLPPRDAQAVNSIYSQLLQLYPQSKGIIFSSTGVYTAANPARKEKLLQIESIFNQSHFQVVRLGGLIGPDRNLAQIMSGRTVESSEKIRFIHSREIAKFIIDYLKVQPSLGAPFPLYHPQTCDKKTWYTQFQKAKQLPLSQFIDESPNTAEVPSPQLPFPYEWIWENVLEVELS